MNINWYGHACFKISAKSSGLADDSKPQEVLLIIAPFDKKIGLKPPRGKADIVVVTHSHYDHNNISSILLTI